jgi:hypothetical protein
MAKNTYIVGMIVTPEEKHVIKVLAAKENKSVSQYLRDRCLK